MSHICNLCITLFCPIAHPYFLERSLHSARCHLLHVFGLGNMLEADLLCTCKVVFVNVCICLVLYRTQGTVPGLLVVVRALKLTTDDYL